MKRLNIIIVAIAVLGLVVLAGCPAPTSGIGTPTPSPSPASGGEVPAGEPAYTVTYDGNGASGSAPVDNHAYPQGAAVTVMTGYGGSLSLPGYALAGWTTNVDGTGTSYAGSASFTMGTADMTLFAVWIPRNLAYISWKTDITLTGHSIPYPSGSLTIPAGVTRVISGAFTDCTDLTDVSIPASVNSLNGGAFSGCTSLTVISVDQKNTTYQSISGTVFDKSGSTLVAVPPGSVAGSYAIRSGVVIIGPQVFSRCTGLTDISFPASLTTIGEYAFTGCSNWTSISVDADNPAYQSIAGVLFDKSGAAIVLVPIGLTGIYDIPSGVTSIRPYTFLSCQGLTSIDIPSSVTEIGAHAFEFCTSLTDITVPGSVSTIGDNAFYACSLNKAVINPGVASVGAFAFSGCPLGDGVSLPEGLISIGTNAFCGCSELLSVAIPSSVTSIGEDSFGACFKLDEFVVDPANTNYESLDGVLFDKSGTSLTLMSVPNGKSGKYDIPAGVVKIGEDAIGGCSALTEVTIPDSVVSIGKDAFTYCKGLNVIAIPSSVTNIGEYAFGACSSLTSVTLASNAPPDLPSGSQAFDGCASGLKIHVPDAAAYANATGSAIGWRDYASKIVSP
jgi:hypothetical protein